MKVTIAGNAYVITSDIKASDVELLKKNNPSALSVKDEDGNDVFTVGYNPNKPSITSFGITFDGISRDEAKCLTLTDNIPAGEGDAKEFVIDKIGVAMANLQALEKSIPEAVKAVNATRKAISDKITVA